jgi:protein-L-isoaspartate(D-aspartate) O-methyltransferase
MSEELARQEMVRRQLEERDITDPRVLEAMRRVPRHLFVPERFREHAYEDRPQPIGCAQTISQPLMVGLMTQLLELTPEARVLEIGTGSGYQAAILAEIAREVISIERQEALACRARELLEWLGYSNIQVLCGDGTKGWPDRAPYQGIIITAAAPSVPEPLVEQIAPGGRLVAPIGSRDVQTLIVMERLVDGELRTTSHGECVFVPLIGEFGWQPDAPPSG